MAVRRRPSRRWVSAATVLALGVTVSLVVTPASPASAAVDLALGKVATADSAEPARPARLANDGDAATRWCAADGRTGHWWQVDLGTATDLTSTQVVWEFARNYRYQISVSTNGTAWTTVADKNANTSTAQSQSDTFTARARYVRVTVTGLAAGTWASIQSFSVFGAQGSETREPSKGIAGPACPDVKAVNASWWYNWWIYPGDCTAPGFVPTISGKDQRNPGQVQWALDRVKEAGHTTLLGFNEPNKADQGNLTVDHAISLWPTLTSNGNIKVSSPATSADKGGQDWFTEFMRRVEASKGTQNELRVDIVAIHWYGWNTGSCTDMGAFKGYLNWAERLAGDRPIWLTEFGCMNQSNPNPTVVADFYRAAMAELQNRPRVQRHAWYPWLEHNGLSAGGALTPVGTAVSQAPAYR